MAPVPFPSSVRERACPWLVWFVALLTAAVSTDVAQAQPVASPRVALVIGNSDYPNSKDRLPGALHDAEVIKAALEQTQFRVRLVPNANLQQLKTAITAFQAELKQAGGAGIGILYYAGHGGADPQGRENFLLPVDVDTVGRANVREVGVSVQWVLDTLSQADEARGLVVIVDACRSTASGAESGGADATGSAPLGMAKPSEQSGQYLIAFSTSERQPASDNGLYAKVLAEKLVTPGKRLTQVFEDVRIELAEKHARQRPVYTALLDKPLCLVSCEADAMRENAERISAALRTVEQYRRELDATRAERQDNQRRLDAARRDAIADILRLTELRDGAGRAIQAKVSLERGDVAAAEALLQSLEAEALAKKDLREAARIERQIGGLASTHSVRLAMAAFRRAADNEPQNPENWRLVGALWRRSADLDEAQRAYEQLVKLLSESASRAPGDGGLQRQLADAYGRLGSVLAQTGYHGRAQEASQSAIKILEPFVAADRVSPVLLDEYGQMQTQLGVASLAIGDTRLAKVSFANGLAAYRRFSRTEKSGVSTGLAIGDLQRNLGGALLAESNGPAALEHFRTALAIHEGLAEEFPKDGSVLRGLGLAQRGVGYGLVAVRDYAGARAAFSRAMGTTQRLMASDQKDVVLRYELARIHYGLGETASGEQAQLPAVQSFDAALGILSDLVVANPKRVPWLQEKVRANTRMGDATAAYGGEQQAVATYRNSLVMHEELAKRLKSTGVARERRNQATSIDQVGNRLSGLKDYASALMAYRSALAVREDLLRSNAADAETEADISVSCWNISRMKGVTSVDAAEAQKQLERGKEILRGLRERGQLPKPYADFEQKFDGALQRAAGR